MVVRYASQHKQKQKAQQNVFFEYFKYHITGMASLTMLKSQVFNVIHLTIRNEIILYNGSVINI